ncbi:tripartite tricarboxylate transporter substrate binding protein [Pseudaquabacterium terrae]|nr:tripartite tricarboxylate transporter substrate binding protein [Aquabacterium terrae]
MPRLTDQGLQVKSIRFTICNNIWDYERLFAKPTFKTSAMPGSKSLLTLLALACAALTHTAALAQGGAAWPSRPVTLVVPFPPGGNTDTMGRIIGERLSAVLKQTVIVDNKPGAGSMIGSQFVARSLPDGHTLLVGSISNALNHFFYRKPLYDITKDLVPVAHLVQVPNYLAVGPNAKFKTLPEIIAYAKAHPKGLSCATTGVGTSPYLSCELFKRLAGVDIVNVPYKGGAPALQDAMGGQVDMVFANEALPFIADKRLIGVAVTTPKRSPFAPELPAIAETLPRYDVTAWYGVFAPAGTPEAVIRRLSAEINEALKDEVVLAKLKTLGATPVVGTPKDFAAYVDAELKRWGDIIRPMNVSLD